MKAKTFDMDPGTAPVLLLQQPTDAGLTTATATDAMSMANMPLHVPDATFLVSNSTSTQQYEVEYAYSYWAFEL